MSNTPKTTPLVSHKRNVWRWGLTPESEIWNGRFAMIGFLSIVLLEVFSGQGFLHFWGIF